MVDRVNELSRAFTVIFTDSMRTIKPSNPRAEDYSEKIQSWNKAFEFTKELQYYVNELNNMIVLAGKPNSSEGVNNATRKFIEKLNKEQKSSEFKRIMETAKPNIGTEPDYDEKIKAWENAFVFPDKLKDFTKKLEQQTANGSTITSDKYLELIDQFIKDLENRVDDKIELCIKQTKNIGGQQYKVNYQKCQKEAEKNTEELVQKIQEKEPYKNMKPEQKEQIKKDLLDFKKSRLEVKAEKKILEKKYDEYREIFESEPEKESKVKIHQLSKALEAENQKAKPKKYPKYMDYLVIFGIVGIFILMVLSITCPFKCETTVIDGVPVNIYTQILESNVMIVLTSTIIAPVAARILKEKFDIDVTAKDIQMIISDGTKAVTMYAKEADKLRDADGHIPRKYQEVLRNKAFTAIRNNYTFDKYNEIIANVGAQVFEKSIEHAVTTGKITWMPLEKEKVEAVIKQGIDAYPFIVEWKNLEEEAKEDFIDGNIKKVLQNVGVNGWAYKALENVFDAEVSQRLTAAAMVNPNILTEIDKKNPYLKYTSTILQTVLAKPQPNLKT